MKTSIIPVALLLALSVPCSDQTSTITSTSTSTHCAGCARSSRRCRPSRPPNWWRHLLACLAKKKDKLEFRNHHLPFAPPSCGAFFISHRSRMR